MHVGIDATHWQNNRGFGRFTRELVSALLARDSGINYTLFFDHVAGDGIPVRARIVEVSARRTMRKTVVSGRSRNPKYLWAMGAAVSKVDPDIFFFPSSWSYFPLLSRTPCVLCIHDMIPEQFPKMVFPRLRNRTMWRIKMAMARRQASRIMTVSQSSARDINRSLRISPDRIDVITEGPSEHFRPIDDDGKSVKAVLAKYGLPVDTNLFLYVGGMNRHKNVHALLDAMCRVVGQKKEVHLAIVGDISDEGFWTDSTLLQDKVRQNPVLTRHVHFTGYVPDEDLTGLLNASVALVFPSFAEGFGLPAVEAMACGTPVLASNRGSLPEVVGDAGLIFDPEDIHEIASCMVQLLQDTDMRAKLSGRALLRAGRFTWSRAAELAESSFSKCFDGAAGDPTTPAG